MKTENLIPVNKLSVNYNIEHSFVITLQESGLIELVTLEEELYVPADELQNFEKMVTLYYEMGINIEGIETITYLLQRLSSMQQHIIKLRNKLDLYEAEH
jgi:chaperone modulatory protein CbpM